MENKNHMTDAERGWAYLSQVLGANYSSQSAHAYVGRVEDAVAQLSADLAKLKTNGTIQSIGGFAAETWHADTFNIDAVAANSNSRAEVLVGDRNMKWSTDIRVKTDDGASIDYGVKYMKDAGETAKHQSLLNTETREAGYKTQNRLVPSDQRDDVIKIANRRANAELRLDVAEAYSDTASKTVDTVSDGKISSKPLSKGDDLAIARDIKEEKVNVEKYGVSAADAINPGYVMKQAVKAGLDAAVITMIMQTGPELFKAISYLIKTGELDMNQVRKVGIKAVSSSAEGFLRGSIACALQVLCEKGVLGNLLKNIDPMYLGSFVAITLETIKNSILCATGRMTAKEMGTALVDNILITSGYIVGAKIGGIIGQALGFGLPVIGYILGSLIGCSFAAVYNFGKKKLISFCVDTGFTCFGLVEQDYCLPEEVLYSMGIDVTPIERSTVEHIELNRVQLSNDFERTPVDQIELKVLRRGIIGVNKIGYTY